MTEVWLISGPNLDQLGHRDPALYGSISLEALVERFTRACATFNAEVHHVQSNHEGVLVEAIHAARERAGAIVINPGALTHSSWSLRDALELFRGPKIEVHLSNPAAREPFRHQSTIAAVVTGSIAGFGPRGYDLAAAAVRALLEEGAGAGA